ncbi:MAG TPA: SDR family NAD(P)-dependent oxidoreductase [Opitutus sp.]|nr:SDR family NAD(P)-dependent oxidoreductase [Opitutus sp.]
MSSGEGIAIIGLAARFPGADSVEAFWRNLRNGTESVSFFSDDELRAAGIAPTTAADPRYVKANGVLRDADKFDAAFFGMTPREAEATDPQHRVFLELAWEALERAGYDAARTPGRVGVFAGAGMSTYLLKNLAPNRALVESVGELALLLGNNKDFVPTRVSYKLDLRGPSVNVNTACSTSLVATHLACQSLLDFHCDMALAGGVAVQVPQMQGYFHTEGGIGSPDGRCRAFDAEARGTVSGNGAGIVVLKRLADALADGDMIHAVIRGSAVNNDGADKVGFTAPSVRGQSQVIAEALAVAGLEPAEISYVEAHGTGTELGDPIEVAALTEVFGDGASRPAKCALGSVKTNFGHLDEAAGVAGLIKTVLALRHRELPASLHYTRPNPKIDFARSAFAVNAKLTPWSAPAGAPRRAGVSSFGIGGTNAHVVLEEAPPLSVPASGAAWQLLVLSARTPTALARAAENLATWLEGTATAAALADVAWTLAMGRRVFDQRRFVVARDRREAAALLRGSRNASEGAPSALVESGRAWAAGGTADWAAHFAGQKRRRVELPTYPFERQRYWIEAPRVEAVTESAAAPTLAAWKTSLATLEARLARDPNCIESPSYPAFARELQAWCGLQLFHYFATGAGGVRAGEKIHWPALRERLGVQPAFHKAAEAFLGALADDGYVRRTGDEVEWRRGSGEVPAVEAGRRALLAKFPEFHGIARLVEHCTQHYAEALSGKIPAITVIYPEGRSDLLEETARENARHTNKDVYIGLLQEAIERKLAAANGRTLRVLEAGVGDGLLAGKIAPGLKGRNVEYVATDLGRTFVAKAEKAARAAGLDFLQFGVLDISCDPTTQGFARGSFDVIVCLDVIHATPRLAETLGHLRTLLAPGGLLGVVEKVRAERWVDLVWGLAEGWWYFADSDIRRHGPLLAAEGWERLLRGLSFAEVAVFPQSAEARAATDYAVLLAQAPLAATVATERMAPAGAADIARWFHVPVWREAARRRGLDVGTGARVTIVGEYGNLGARLSERWRRAGLTVIQAKAADDLMPGGQRPSQIVYLGAAGPDDNLAASERAFFELTQLARGLAGAGGDCALSLVSTQACAVKAGEIVHPAKALPVGALRVIPRECPGVACRQIDLTQIDDAAIDWLAGELLSPVREPLVAWRAGKRWVQEIRVEELGAVAGGAGLRERGVYLITGGLGSMGLAFARELARSVHARIALLGRTAPSSAQLACLREIEALGGEVLAATADVSDRASVAQAVDAVRRRFGAIHGVIHTAGVYGQGAMWERPEAAVRAIWAPKVAGTLALAEALRGEKLDFLVLCASLAASRPVAGQADYCAANAFLDAWAGEQARRTGIRTISIEWGMWQELGMMEHASIAAAQKQSVRDEIAREGWHDSGVAAFRRILAHGSSGVVCVSPQPLRSATPPAHPLLQERRDEGRGRVDYLVRLDPKTHWVVDEHRLDGLAILPGTAYLELARAAFADFSGVTAVELSEVYFLRPLVFERDEAREVRVILRNGVFQIVSSVGPDRWLEHARGEVRAASGNAPAAEPAVGEARPAVVPADAVKFGPRWRNLRTLGFGPNHGVAGLALAPELAGDIEDFALHPALLDMATGFITLRHALPDSLPFSYRRVVMHAPLTARLRSTVRVSERTDALLEVDATLTDENDLPLVTIEGYRLRRMPAAPSSTDANVRLAISAQGGVDSLALVCAARRPPGPGEVEIQIEAAGLNFIEVLYALGMLPASPELENSFGLEGAGRIVAVGAGVTDFAVGDSVVAYANGCFAAFVTAPANAVAKRPAGLGAAEAATLPAAFATAHHALVTQGRLAAGERVLIHAAAGGVGMAAVQIAQRIGAEVFATAGSPEKRAALRALGVKHVMDSRTLAFADDVQAATNGRGVDVVLNSLGGEFLSRSLELVAPRGRFLELGKRDLFKGGALPLQPFTRIISFIVIDVGPDLPGFAALWREVAERFATGAYRPLPHTAFALTKAREAFDFMARAKHLGKVVLAVDDLATLRSQATSARASATGRSLAAILGTGEPALAEPSRPAAEKNPKSEIQNPKSLGHVRPDLGTDYVAPSDDVEIALAAIWQELLGLERVGIRDDFFDLNGDSLLAAQVTARVHTALQVKLPLSVLFDAPTIAELAERVRAGRGGRAASSATVAAPAAAGESEEGEI